MKITRVEPLLVRTPLKLDDAQPHAGGQPKNDVHTVLLKVETDEGLTGWGEAFSNVGWQSTCTAIAQIIAPRVIGRDPSHIAQIQADLHRGLYNTGRSGPTVFAISGLANKDFKRPFSPVINLSLSRRGVNRHPQHDLLPKNSPFAGFFGPFMCLGQLILARRGTFPRTQAERDPRSPC